MFSFNLWCYILIEGRYICLLSNIVDCTCLVVISAQMKCFYFKLNKHSVFPELVTQFMDIIYRPCCEQLNRNFSLSPETTVYHHTKRNASSHGPVAPAHDGAECLQKLCLLPRLSCKVSKCN